MKELSCDEFKQIQIQILSEIKIFCEKNGLNYYLAYGTLLGAVRHQGFIPWDEDIDIVMPRIDYLKFEKLFKHDRFEFLSISKDATYPYHFGKVLDKNTILVDDSSSSYDIGVNIDVFPIDGLPSSEMRKRIHCHFVWFLQNIATLKLMKYVRKRGMIKNIILAFLKFIFIPFPLYTVLKAINNYAMKYSMEKSSEYLLEGAYKNREVVCASIFQSKMNVVFENESYSAPVGTNSWLMQLYGNYMEMPPVERRISTHNYKVLQK